MAEKRKCRHKVVLHMRGKSKPIKIEIFGGSQWSDVSLKDKKKFRFRINGKWYPFKVAGMCFYTKQEFRDILMLSMGPL